MSESGRFEQQGAKTKVTFQLANAHVAQRLIERRRANKRTNKEKQTETELQTQQRTTEEKKWAPIRTQLKNSKCQINT